ncbi:trypsin-like serine protease [Streptomyces sp. NPDC058579]|uniref:trypsin-like serine protease n=1 Tax=Streptomyces sp. NPDC058579 TaxID=3346548 RepID=UPI003655CA1A
MRPTRPAALAAHSATLIAAPLMLTGAPARAAAGTPITDSSHAFTAQLQIGSSDQTRGCSGALVAPQWIVTAASCFAVDPLQGDAVAPGAPALKTVATIGRPDLTAGTGGHVTEVTELVPRVGRDLVLARLAMSATGIEPVPLASEPPAAGDTSSRPPASPTVQRSASSAGGSWPGSSHQGACVFSTRKVKSPISRYHDRQQDGRPDTSRAVTASTSPGSGPSGRRA